MLIRSSLAQRPSARLSWLVLAASASSLISPVAVVNRTVTDQVRPKVPKLAALMDSAEEDVLVLHKLSHRAPGQAALDELHRGPER